MRFLPPKPYLFLAAYAVFVVAAIWGIDRAFDWGDDWIDGLTYAASIFAVAAVPLAAATVLDRRRRASDTRAGLR